MAAVLHCSSLPGARQADSLSSFHETFTGPLKRFFRSYRLNSADAEDLTQEVFVRLAGSRERTHLLKPESFVFTLARNLVRDRARRLHTQAATRSITLDDVDLSCQRPTPDQWLELTQQLEQVEQTLASLKPTTREAFTLHRVHGESCAAIAMHMKVSVSMVEKHIMSATIALRAANS
jgi:RNA polymerase sigma factor (sigma-70 family)